jgi:hypothetical protein
VAPSTFHFPFSHGAGPAENRSAALAPKTQVTSMKSILMPALGLAAALALSPVAGISAADAATMHHKHHHTTHHHPHHTVHHQTHHKHHTVHHTHKKHGNKHHQ